jgi:hypothetical protein
MVVQEDLDLTTMTRTSIDSAHMATETITTRKMNRVKARATARIEEEGSDKGTEAILPWSQPLRR